jgi:hypothetical protein
MRGKGLCADYVLVYRNRKLAVIEAKAWDEELTLGVGQAKNYAGKMELRFAYSTNGQGLSGIDMETGKEAECPYPTPAELWAKTFATENAWRDQFNAIPFPDKSGTWLLRFYQEIAVNRVLERIADGHSRAADAGDRNGQDVDRVSDRVEAVRGAVEPPELARAERLNAPAAHLVPRRSEHAGESGVQRLHGVRRR